MVFLAISHGSSKTAKEALRRAEQVRRRPTDPALKKIQIFAVSGAVPISVTGSILQDGGWSDSGGG